MLNLRQLTILWLLLCSALLAQPQLKIPDDCRQLVVVRNRNWDDTTAVLHRFERVDSGWRQVGGAVQVNLGRTGLAWGASPLMGNIQLPDKALRKREGDGRSPAGLFPILRCFGHPTAPVGYGHRNLPFLAVETEQCVDDKSSKYYNQVVNPEKVGGVSWNSAERMKIGVYRLGMVVGHNCPKAKPGFGSCIFFHIQSGPGEATAGCTSMEYAPLKELALWLERDKHPLVVQLPEAVYAGQGESFPTPR